MQLRTKKRLLTLKLWLNHETISIQILRKNFNDTIIERQENDIYLRQIFQSDHFQVIQDIDIAIISSRDKIRLALILKEQYVTQRARDAYVASICQFETSFDSSLAVESIEISSKNIAILNKRLQWQINNHTREFKYDSFDSTKFQLMIFTNSFFVNNRDVFS